MTTTTKTTLKQTRGGANASYTAYRDGKIIGAIGRRKAGGLYETFGFTRLGDACLVGVFETKDDALVALSAREDRSSQEPTDDGSHQPERFGADA